MSSPGIGSALPPPLAGEGWGGGSSRIPNVMYAPS
jgi:hypothetical protein